MSDQGSTYIWERINKYYQATRKPIHVAVAYTADAAAASLTLSSLLKASLIAYDIQPVATNEELRAMIASANLAQEYAQLSDTDPLVDEVFLLVGLGGAIPLRDYFDLTRRHVVIVLDAYRPIHLDNLRRQEDERLMIWGSDRIREDVDAFFRAQRQAAALQRRRRRRRAALKRRTRLRHQYGDGPHASTGFSDEDGEGVDDESTSSDDPASDSDDQDGDDGASLSVSQSQERVDWTDAEGLPPYLETAYYACERAGRSCALEAHELAVLLNRFRDATLWHAAVGVCDLFNRRLIDYATYLVDMRPLHDAVTLQKSVRRGGGRGRAGDVDDDDENGEQGSETTSAAYLRKRSSNAMELHNHDEEQLYLLRHSSLWDAVWHHPVTASVLRLHHAEDGEGLLRQLLARCGVSAKMAQQPWREVPQADKAEALRLVQTELRDIMESRAKFLTFPNEIRCVSRTVGYSTEVSTFDACTLHEALLAAVPPSSATTLEADFAADAATAQRLVADRLRRFHRDQFWKAHAILDMDASASEFADAVHTALSLQQAIATATGALMQPGMLQSTAGLHYIIPSDPTRTTTALESFSTVYRLNALGRRLLLTLTVERGLGRYTQAVRPLLVACALPRPVREEADHSFVVGATGVREGTALNAVAMNTLPFTGESSKQAAAAATAHGSSTPRSGNMQDGLLSGGGGGGGGGLGAAEEHEFLVVLTHAGAAGSSLTPIPSVGRLLACLHDPEEFDPPPQQRYLAQRTTAVVADRATAAHLADAMYLACLSSKWDPQREYVAALAEAQEAQGPAFAHQASDGGSGYDDDDDPRIDRGHHESNEGGDDDAEDGDEEEEDSGEDEDRYFGQALRERSRIAPEPAPTDEENGSNHGPISAS